MNADSAGVDQVFGSAWNALAVLPTLLFEIWKNMKIASQSKIFAFVKHIEGRIRPIWMIVC